MNDGGLFKMTQSSGLCMYGLKDINTTKIISNSALEIW